jgi:hypothetical protein
MVSNHTLCVSELCHCLSNWVGAEAYSALLRSSNIFLGLTNMSGCGVCCVFNFRVSCFSSPHLICYHSAWDVCRWTTSLLEWGGRREWCCILKMLSSAKRTWEVVQWFCLTGLILFWWIIVKVSTRYLSFGLSFLSLIWILAVWHLNSWGLRTCMDLIWI